MPWRLSFPRSGELFHSEAVPGKQVFLISGDNLRLPRNVELLDLVPSSMELTLASIVEQEVTVKPQLVGKLPAGLKIIKNRSDPPKSKGPFS
jgi:hypothetical protein